VNRPGRKLPGLFFDWTTKETEREIPNTFELLKIET